MSFANENYAVFSGNLASQLEPTQSLVIAGKADENATSITINLSSDRNIINLSMNIQFVDNIIARCAFAENRWTKPEFMQNLFDLNDRNPIGRGEIFIINIVAGDRNFYIAINDKPFCQFEYDLPLERVRYVRIYGDLKKILQFDHRQVFPSPIPKIQVNKTRDIFTNDIPVRFQPGHIIVLTAIPVGNPLGHFIIYFTEDEKPLQAFYFDARFQKSHSYIILNFMNPQFNLKDEIRLLRRFPFKFEKTFRMVIGFTRSAFVIAVNGKHLHVLPYRRKDLLNVLNGLRMRTRHELDVNVVSLRHIKLNTDDCIGYEFFSVI